MDQANEGEEVRDQSGASSRKMKCWNNALHCHSELFKMEFASRSTFILCVLIFILIINSFNKFIRLFVTKLVPNVSIGSKMGLMNVLALLIMKVI